jgi:hypothetical protein
LEPKGELAAIAWEAEQQEQVAILPHLAFVPAEKLVEPNYYLLRLVAIFKLVVIT